MFVKLFANSSYLLSPDVRRAAAMATALPLTTRSFCWSGASLLTLWKSWSLDPARTWPTTVTTQRRIQGRRWSSMQNQVWATVSQQILPNKQSVGVYGMLSGVISCMGIIYLWERHISCRFPVMKSNAIVCVSEYVCFSLDIFRHLNGKLCQPLQASSWVCISFQMQSFGLPSAKWF